MMNISQACDENLRPYLEEAKSIATKLPQVNGELEKSRKYDDQYWIKDPASIASTMIGGYRYLIHDIAIGYAKIGCWEQALTTADLIKNLGIRDSAWAQIAIEYAKNDSFDNAMKLIKAIKYPRGGKIARKYVSKELVRAGQNEEARKVLRGAGIFGNHYESYFYQNAMTLARLGKHDEAVKYVHKLNGMKHHVRNAFGDMLLLFQERGDSSNAQKILSYYESGKSKDIPVYQLSRYYLKENNLEKSNEYGSTLKSPQQKANLMLDLAEKSKNEEFFIRALDVIDKRFNQDPKNNWTIISHTAYKIYSLKGQNTSNKFIYKYIDKNDHKAELGHMNIIRKLFSENRLEDVAKYLKNVDGKLSKRKFIETIAQIRTRSLKEIPSISMLNINAYRYRFVVIELLKNRYYEDDILKTIEDNYVNKNSTFHKAELLNITAMVASNNLGHNVASSLYTVTENKLLQAYWLLGVSQKNQANEINSALKYKTSFR